MIDIEIFVLGVVLGIFVTVLFYETDCGGYL